MTPKIAVISVGHWDFGKPTKKKEKPKTLTTFAFGHPRTKTIDLLTVAVTSNRDPATTQVIFDAVKKKKPFAIFPEATIKKAIYATACSRCWRCPVSRRAGTLVASADAERSEISRGHFISSPIARNIVGQSRSTIDLRRIMDEGRVLTVNLSKGRIGDDASPLFGSLIVSAIQIAAMSRSNVAEVLSERLVFLP